MQSQERDLISGLFGRIQQFETQPRDPEAEALIASSIARQPGGALSADSDGAGAGAGLEGGAGAYR